MTLNNSELSWVFFFRDTVLFDSIHLSIIWRARIAHSVKRLAAGWTTNVQLLTRPRKFASSTRPAHFWGPTRPDIRSEKSATHSKSECVELHSHATCTPSGIGETLLFVPVLIMVQCKSLPYIHSFNVTFIVIWLVNQATI
jgi:hypothetical protein